MTAERETRDWVRRAERARAAAHEVLGNHEAARSRVVILEQLLQRLSGLPVDIQDYFREAATCLEVGARRAAIVLAWAGFFHTVAEQVLAQHEPTLRAKRPKWKFKDLDELKEGYAEAQILDAAREVGLIKKAELRIFQGQLSMRNLCAHPTLYAPSLNVAIGYVDSVLVQTVTMSGSGST